MAKRKTSPPSPTCRRPRNKPIADATAGAEHRAPKATLLRVEAREHGTTITVFIRYRIDIQKREQFEAYARRWLEIIPKCSGARVGYWLPHEGINDIAIGLISFERLAAYEAYQR